MRLDHPINTATVSLRNITKASFEVAWKIVRSKKHTTLVKNLLNQQQLPWLKQYAEMILHKNLI